MMAKPQTTLDVVGIYIQFQKLDTIAACAALFKKTIAPFGFDVFACGELDLDIRDLVVFYIIEWPDDWRKFYLESGLIERDPLIDAMRFRRTPFTWSELRRDRKLSAVGTKALKLCADYGWVEGLAVPVWRGGTRFGLVSLVGRSMELSPQQRNELALISECLLSRVRALGLSGQFPVPPAGLTGREIDSLKLVALGHSDAQIAEILGISRWTVHQHVEAGRKRLHAKSRAQMVGRCVSLGIIDEV